MKINLIDRKQNFQLMDIFLKSISQFFLLIYKLAKELIIEIDCVQQLAL